MLVIVLPNVARLSLMVVRSGDRLVSLMPKRKTSPPKKAVAEVKANFQAGYDGQFPTVYSNFAAITHTRHEFCMDFCLLAPAYQIDIDNKMVTVPVVARIIIPPKLVEGLRDALKVELDKYNTEDPDRILIPTPRSSK